MMDKHSEFSRPFLYPFEMRMPIIIPEINEPVRGAKWFRSSFQLDVRYSNSYRLRKLLDFIMAELKTVISISSHKKTRHVLKTVILNLFDSRTADVPINYSRNKNYYSKNRRYGNKFFKYDRVIPLIDALKKLGYINEQRGFRNPDTNDGWETRMWGTPKLWATYEHFSLITPNLISLTKPEQLLFLRDDNDKDIQFKQTGFTRRIITDLERYNDFIDGFKIAVSLDSNIKVDDEFLTEYLYRNILNNRITLSQVEYNNKSTINKYDIISTPQLLTVSDYPITRYLTKQTTITNTKWSKCIVDVGFQRFQYNHDRLINFLHDRAVRYRPTKEYQRKKNKKKYRIKKKQIPKFPLRYFGIQRLEFSLNYEYLYRVFNFRPKFGKFELGGRAYGALHQNLPRHMRPYIRINGQPTVEIDYSAFHILMLYHKLGIDYQDDPYTVCEGYKMRETYKAVGLIAINAENDKEAYGAIWEELEDRNIPLPSYKEPLKTLLNTFRDAHKPISKYLFSGEGLSLQNIDGNIMNAILVRLMNKDILGLSVYDSVIVAEQYADILREIMVAEYEKVMKFKPKF